MMILKEKKEKHLISSNAAARWRHRVVVVLPMFSAAAAALHNRDGHEQRGQHLHLKQRKLGGHAIRKVGRCRIGVAGQNKDPAPRQRLCTTTTSVCLFQQRSLRHPERGINQKDIIIVVVAVAAAAAAAAAHRRQQARLKYAAAANRP